MTNITKITFQKRFEQPLAHKRRPQDMRLGNFELCQIRRAVVGLALPCNVTTARYGIGIYNANKQEGFV